MRDFAISMPLLLPGSQTESDSEEEVKVQVGIKSYFEVGDQQALVVNVFPHFPVSRRLFVASCDLFCALKISGNTLGPGVTP